MKTDQTYTTKFYAENTIVVLDPSSRLRECVFVTKNRRQLDQADDPVSNHSTESGEYERIQ
jgi:hypothetical protein